MLDCEGQAGERPRVFCFGRAKRKEQRGYGGAEGRTGSVMTKPGEQPAIKSPVRPSAAPAPRRGA